jgi:hypothetical protein
MHRKFGEHSQINNNGVNALSPQVAQSLIELRNSRLATARIISLILKVDNPMPSPTRNVNGFLITNCVSNVASLITLQETVNLRRIRPQNHNRHLNLQKVSQSNRVVDTRRLVSKLPLFRTTRELLQPKVTDAPMST